MMRERGGRLVDRYIDRQLRGLLGERAIDATIWRDLRQYEVIALAVIEQFWHIEVRGGEDYWHLLLPPRGDSTPDTLARGAAQVVERLGDEAGTSAAAFVLHPQLWSPAYTAWRGGSGGPGQFARARLLVSIAEHVIHHAPPPDLVARLAGRLQSLCAATGAEGYPDFAACLGWLAAIDEVAYTTMRDLAQDTRWAELALRLSHMADAAAPLDLAVLRAQWALATGDARGR